MDSSISNSVNNRERRQRLHEILIALIHKQEDFELMDVGSQGFEAGILNSKENDPGRWIKRNQRILNKYQSLVNTAIALDSLLEAEEFKS